MKMKAKPMSTPPAVGALVWAVSEDEWMGYQVRPEGLQSRSTGKVFPLEMFDGWMPMTTEVA